MATSYHEHDPSISGVVSTEGAVSTKGVSTIENAVQQWRICVICDASPATVVACVKCGMVRAGGLQGISGPCSLCGDPVGAIVLCERDFDTFLAHPNDLIMQRDDLQGTRLKGAADQEANKRVTLLLHLVLEAASYADNFSPRQCTDRARHHHVASDFLDDDDDDDENVPSSFAASSLTEFGRHESSIETGGAWESAVATDFVTAPSFRHPSSVRRCIIYLFMTHPWRARRLQRAWRSLRGRNGGGDTSKKTFNDNGLRLLEFISCVTASSSIMSQLPSNITCDFVSASLAELQDASLHTRVCFASSLCGSTSSFGEELTCSDLTTAGDADHDDSPFSQLTHLVWIKSSSDRLNSLLKAQPEASNLQFIHIVGLDCVLARQGGKRRLMPSVRPSIVVVPRCVCCHS